MKITVANVGVAVIEPDKANKTRKSRKEIPNYVVYPTIELSLVSDWSAKFGEWLAEFAPGWKLKGWVAE